MALLTEKNEKLWQELFLLAKTIFAGKNYFCQSVFSTNWQKLANPDNKFIYYRISNYNLQQ